MIDWQLGRRNLTPAQRVAVTEKYRPKFEEKARENKSLNGGDKKSELANLPNAVEDKINTRSELAKLANVGERTYGKIVKVLNSDDEDLKQKLIKDEISADTAYRKIMPKKEVPEIKNESDNKVNDIKPQETIISPSPTTKICEKCGMEKPLIDFFTGDKICKDCKRNSDDSVYTQGGGG